MNGFPINFGVNAGHPVLEHPLYLKWNQMTVKTIISGKSQLADDIDSVMATNDNMPILWYLMSLWRIIREMS